MAINFPNSPTLNQTFQSGGKSYIWNGSAWSGFSTSLTVNYNASSIVVADGNTTLGATTSINFGDNLTVTYDPSGIATVSATGTSSQWVTVAAGIHTTSNVGIGTTNPQGTLQVGTGITMYGSTGIISATTFVGNFSGSITDATNLTGGYANASRLNVSGITTISQGRIQADASANLRFGNLAVGSGSVGRNIAIGDQVLPSLSGGQGRNIALGELSYFDTTTGQYNIGIGVRAGEKITSGSNNVILGGYNGNSGGLDLRTSSNNVVIADGEGNIRQYINSLGNVGIKTTVITEALTVAGIVSATGFHGTLNASQLTGSLPAIDGSALTGVVGSGSGVVIQDDTTPVGTAGTINFGSNLTVSFVSGIATVSGASSVSNATTAYNLAGTPNLNVGIVTATSFNGPLTGNVTGNVSGSSATAGYATTAGISSAVSGTININTTGIITASSFSGSGSGLTNLPSGQLTGALPALDGSALINLPAQPGDGVNVRDDNNPVGSARTVNFGTGLEVTITNNVATVNASAGTIQSRTIVSGTTSSIGVGATANLTITGHKSYSLMKVGVSTAAWVVLYSDTASRTSDASRTRTTDPTPGSGVIAEVITTGISTVLITPAIVGWNDDATPSNNIYAKVTNLGTSTQQVTVNLTILKLED